MKERYQNRIELLQGTLDMLILQTLQWGPQHGYALASAIRANSGEVLRVETGSLYPALHRLEKQGWVVWMYWFGVASVPLLALLSTFIRQREHVLRLADVRRSARRPNFAGYSEHAGLHPRCRGQSARTSRP